MAHELKKNTAVGYEVKLQTTGFSFEYLGKSLVSFVFWKKISQFEVSPATDRFIASHPHHLNHNVEHCSFSPPELKQTTTFC